MKWTTESLRKALQMFNRRHVLASATVASLAAMTNLAWAYDHQPANSSDLTAVLNGTSTPALAFGDTITLQAGTLYTGTFTLPNLGTGSSHVTIRSSNLASLPAAGTRVNLTHASNMPKIQPANSVSPAFKTATTAHHFKLVGLEVLGPVADTQPDGITVITWAPIELGTSGTAQDTLAEVPHNIIIDRCIVRANSNTQRIKRGIAINSASTDITDCHISGFKDPNNDTQAINGYNGPGPFNIINNYIEGACENIMIGGGTPTIPNLVPSDIIIQKNHIFKPLAWNQHDTANYAGLNWSIKNLFEIKNGRNILVEGNILENHWVDAQAGWSIVLTPANDGSADWTVVEDVTFRNNIVRHISAGPNILAYDQTPDPSEQTKRITFENNLFYDVGGSLWGGNGAMFQIGGDCADVTINHNTTFHPDTLIKQFGAANTRFIFINNVSDALPYAVFASGVGHGNTALNSKFPGCVFTKNVLKGVSASLYNQYPNNFNPTSLGFPTTWDFLQNHGTPGADFSGWKVDASSAYDNTGVLTSGTGSDGKDIGCDMDALVAATAGCISGVWSGGGGGSGLIAYDGFNYTGNLNTQNGGTGFNGAWSAVSGQGNPPLSTGSLTYIGGPNSLDTVGNKLAPSATNQSVRNFSSAINAANSTKWVSFRIKRTVTGSLPSNHVGFPLYPSSNGGGTSIFLGKPGGASNWGVDIGGSQSNVSGTANIDAFLLYKLAFTSTQVTVSMWVNPSLASESSLGTSHLTPLTVSHGGVLSSMKMSTGANSTSYQLDEFRIGGSFADVTPGTQVEVIVDNPAATTTGTWTTSTWTGGGQFEGTNYLHDGNTGKGSKTCRWTPTVPATGSYEVFARWTSNTDRTTAAPYAIQHAGGTANVTKNQQSQGGTWVSLGMWTFNSGAGGYVQLGNGGTTGYVIADAVRFVKQ